MLGRLTAIGALWTGVLIASQARAELTAFWRNNLITADAIADDPLLATMQSWSVMITNTDGIWASAGLRATLPPQSHFYRHPNGGAFRPSLADQAAHPAMTFHTYVAQPRQAATSQNPPVILGGFPDTKVAASFGGSLDTIPGTFAVAWGDPVGSAHPPGTYEIARLTFPLSVLPEVHPQSRTTQESPQQTILLPATIPEPAAALATVGAFLLRWRRCTTRHAV